MKPVITTMTLILGFVSSPIAFAFDWGKWNKEGAFSVEQLLQEVDTKKVKQANAKREMDSQKHLQETQRQLDLQRTTVENVRRKEGLAPF